MELTPSIITPLTGLLGTIVGIFLNKFLNRKKDGIEYQTQIIENLWKEIGRLEEKSNNRDKVIDQLMVRINSSEAEKKDFLLRIHHLEQENRKQAHEIKELRKKLNEKYSNNDK